MVEPAASPVRLSIDYPDRNLSRLTTFFRIFKQEEMGGLRDMPPVLWLRQ
jgi:hypothetical protein